MKFYFILTNASLELVPKKLARAKRILRWAKFRKKKPTELLLDSTLFHPDVKKLKDYRIRGRPDILHRALLIIYDSPISRAEIFGGTIIENYRGDAYIVYPGVRPPRHYIRFIGLMEQLLKEHIIQTPEGKTLIEKIPHYPKYLDVFGIQEIIVFSEDGRMISKDELSRKLAGIKKNLAIVLGAHPSGPIPSKYINRASAILSLGFETYSTTYALCRILCSLEHLILKENIYKGKKQ